MYVTAESNYFHSVVSNLRKQYYFVCFNQQSPDVLLSIAFNSFENRKSIVSVTQFSNDSNFVFIPKMQVFDLPDCMLEQILEHLPYDEIAKQRIVSIMIIDNFEIYRYFKKNIFECFRFVRNLIKYAKDC